MLREHQFFMSWIGIIQVKRPFQTGCLEFQALFFVENFRQNLQSFFQIPWIPETLSKSFCPHYPENPSKLAIFEDPDPAMQVQTLPWVRVQWSLGWLVNYFGMSQELGDPLISNKSTKRDSFEETGHIWGWPKFEIRPSTLRWSKIASWTSSIGNTFTNGGFSSQLCFGRCQNHVTAIN